MTISVKPYTKSQEQEILALYSSVGWTAYTDHPEILRSGFQKSLLILGAYDEDNLVGIIRAVGDGHTVILIQDILVCPGYQRKGVGTRLVQEVIHQFSSVRQILLVTDDTFQTRAFYESLGFGELSEFQCCGFLHR